MAGFVSSSIEKLKLHFNQDKISEIENLGLDDYCGKFIRNKEILTSNDILAFEWIEGLNMYRVLI